MSYMSIYKASIDEHLRSRVAACVAQEQGVGGDRSPESWTMTHALRWAATPGWPEAYQYALDSGVENPGADEAVITDQMILSAIQPILAAEDEARKPSRPEPPAV